MVMELLQYFDGRPVADALATIADEKGVTLDAALVRKMVPLGATSPWASRLASGPFSLILRLPPANAGT